MEKLVITTMNLLLGLATACSVEKPWSSNAIPYKDVAGAEFKSASYETAIVYVWELGSAGTKIEAKVETLSVMLKDAPIGTPLSKLVIRNLKSQKVIFEQSVDDRPIYMITRDLNGDGDMELIVSWTSGAVAERIEIFTIGENEARRVLDEAYRVDATLADLSDETVDVLITTAESGASPAYTTRYVWQGGQYKPVGRVRYEHFIKQVKGLFRISRPQPRRSPR